MYPGQQNGHGRATFNEPLSGWGSRKKPVPKSMHGGSQSAEFIIELILSNRKERINRNASQKAIKFPA